MRKLTPEAFAEKIHNQYGDAFKLLTKYTGMKNRITIRCNTCLAEHECIAEHLLYRKHRCPNCTQYKKYKYYEELTKDLGHDFILLNMDKQTRIIKHLRCGGEFQISRANFKGHCPICEEESKFLLLESSLRKKFSKITFGKDVQLPDGKTIKVDFYIDDLDVYIDLYGDYLKFPKGRPKIFMPYDQEIYIKQEYFQEQKMKYLCIQNRNDLLDIIYDLNMYFKKHKCSYKHFCRWRCSNGLKKIKIKG